MPTEKSFTDLHQLAARIGQAVTAREAAETLVNWLDRQDAPAMIGLLDSSSASLEIARSPGCQPDDAALAWMQSPEAWLTWLSWHEPRERDEVAELASDRPALLMPLRYEETVYGLLWLEVDAKTAPQNAQLPVLAAHLLAARLHHLAVHSRWDGLLANVNAFSRALLQESSSEAMWQIIHRQLSLLFDASSFFVGLLNPYTSQLTLPLFSQDGVPVYYGTVPLTGLSKAIVQHGTPLLFYDVEAEGERIAKLNVTAEGEQPETRARSWMGVPLRSHRNEVVGLVSVQNLLPGCYSDPDLYLLMFVAGQIAFAVENKRLLQAEQERRKVASTLMDVGQVVNSTQDYEDVLERILVQMQRVVDYDSATIMLPAPGCEDGSRLVVSATNGVSPASRGEELHFGSSTPTALVYLSQQPLVIGDIHEFVGWSANLPTAPQARCWLGVPMRFQERVIGIITLDKSAPHYYSETDASTVFALARQAAVAVENARLHAQAEAHLKSLEQRARRLASMHSIATMLNSSLERDVVLNMAARLLTELFEADHCGIVLIDPKDGNAYLVTEYPSTGSEGMLIPMRDNPILEKLVRGNRALAIYDVGLEVGEQMRGPLERVGGRSTLLAPLFARDQLIGSIGLDMTKERRVFTPDEQETFMTIAVQVALAIHNAQLYEDAVTINRLKSELLANMSHELRTPLNAIIGYSEMLLSQVYGELNAKQLDRLGRVHSGGKHLLSLINDVLDLSRIEAGQMNLVLAPLSIAEVIYDVITDLTPRAQAKGLTVNVELPPDLPQVEADTLRVHQILSNLMDNAIKFTDKGSIAVRARRVVSVGEKFDVPDMAHPQAALPDGEWLAISVSDTGIGISPADQKYIFEAFRQVDSSSVRKYEGTGLGLTIAQQLVKMHRGLIWAESQPGAGSTFTVLLPLSKRHEIPAAAGELAPRDPERPLVLVIDDDPAALQLVQDYLTQDIYQVVGTGNPAQAVEMARRLQPAAIITDIMMPTINGWEVLRALKNDKETAGIPVIILSIIEQKTVGFYLGAADYLVKPINREALLKALERVTRIEPQKPILVVDDNGDDRSFLVDLLERAGYPAAQVDSGQAALDWLAEQSASLVLLDLLLPGMSGFEVLNRLRDNPATADIPVVVVTGADLPAERLEALRAPVLQKGEVSGNSLAQQIRIALNRSLQKRLHQ